MASSPDDPDARSIDALRARVDAVGDFTPAEARVADFYLGSWPGSAFLNLAQASQASGVSTASVTRLAKRLGFADFREMSSWLMAGARRDLERPQDRRPTRPDDHVLSRMFARAEADLQATLSGIDQDAFDRAADLVADGSRPLYLASVASGQPLLEHAGLLLGYLRGGIHVLDGTDRWPHQLAGLDDRSVVLAAAYDRDPFPLMGVLQLAHDVGAASIVVTNQHRSPLLRLADVRLVTTTQRGAMFGSRVSTLCVLEALVDAVAQRSADTADRPEAIERAFSALSIHPRRH